MSTSCFIITDPEENFQIIGTNRVPGLTKDSQWAELAGVTGTLVWIQSFCITHQLEEGQIKIGLDGESAIKALEQCFLYKSDADYDIPWNIRRLLSEIPIQVKFRCIKGHQLDFKNINKLDIWGRLNELADNLAKRYWTAAQHHPHSSNLRITPQSTVTDTPQGDPWLAVVLLPQG